MPISTWTNLMGQKMVCDQLLQAPVLQTFPFKETILLYVLQDFNVAEKLKLVQGDNIICNTAQPFSAFASNPPTVAAGGKLTVHWTNGPTDTSPIGANHFGPCHVYLGQGLKPSGWTKVFETTPDSAGDWCTNIIANNNNNYVVTIPAGLAPGDYVMRIHLAALHAAGSPGGAQFYVRCFDIKVTGSGSSVPPFANKIPGTWNLNTPGVFANNKSPANGGSYANYYPSWGGDLWVPSGGSQQSPVVNSPSPIRTSPSPSPIRTSPSPVTSPRSPSPVTSPRTSPVVSPVTSPRTSPASSPVSGGSGLFSDGFENGLGNWVTSFPSCSGTGTVSIDSSKSNSGKNSLKVAGGGGFCNHAFAANTAIASARPSAFVRFYVNHNSAMFSNHHTFLTMKDANDGGQDLRLGGQNQKLSWNRQSDDATCPSQSPTGVGLSVALPANKWSCLEFEVDTANGYLHAWLDGSAVTALTVQNGVADVDAQWKSSKPNWKPSPQDLKLGWESYGNDSDTYWYDDVVISTSRIGCGSTPVQSPVVQSPSPAAQSPSPSPASSCSSPIAAFGQC
ncbi:hypothetical protein HK098_007310, partial [Nowakowskiella sp. JEL0407]